MLDLTGRTSCYCAPRVLCRHLIKIFHRLQTTECLLPSPVAKILCVLVIYYHYVHILYFCVNKYFT